MPTKRDKATGRFLMQKGQYIDSKGYWCYSAGEHRGKRVHRVLTEKELGRKLRKDEHVHHKNGDKLDNRKSNRQVMGERDHNAVSSKQYWYCKNFVWPKEKAEWDEYFKESAV